MSWCSQLKIALASDSSWRATILMPSSHAHTFNSIIFQNKNVVNNKEYHDQNNMNLSSSSSISSDGISDMINKTNEDSNKISESSSNVITDINLKNDVSKLGSSDSLENLNDQSINANSLSSSTSSSNQSDYNHDTHVDIVHLIGIIPSELFILLNNIATVNLYPKNAVFLFEGYKGLKDKKY